MGYMSLVSLSCSVLTFDLPLMPCSPGLAGQVHQAELRRYGLHRRSQH